jgi:hypothetical protein
MFPLEFTLRVGFPLLDESTPIWIGQIGRAHDEVRPGYRKHTVGSHTLYHRIASAGVIDVVRILHHRMDVDQHLD